MNVTVIRCQSCNAPMNGNICEYCMTTHQIEEIKKTVKITKVSIWGNNNEVSIHYRKDAYMPEINVKGNSGEYDFYTDSDLEIAVRGNSNEVETYNTNIGKQDVIGNNNEISIK